MGGGYKTGALAQAEPQSSFYMYITWCRHRDRERERDLNLCFQFQQSVGPQSLPLYNAMGGGAGLWPEGRDNRPLRPAERKKERKKERKREREREGNHTVLPNQAWKPPVSHQLVLRMWDL